jgi:HlyD family secretion protein
MKRRVVLIVVVLAALLGWYFWQRSNALDIHAAFNIYGNVDVHQVELAFRVSGKLSELKAQEGDRVKAGDILATLDHEPFNNDVAAATADAAAARAQFSKLTHGYRVEEVAQAQASVRQRESDIQNANQTLARLKQLASQQLATAQQIDDASARVRTAEALLASAKELLRMLTRGSRQEDIAAQEALLAAANARLAKAQLALSDSTLTAPTAGIIAVRAREAGAIVQAGQTVYSVALIDPVWIRAYVPEPRLGRMQPGMKVTLTTDSSPGKQYEGTVGFISPEAEFTPKNVQTEQVRDSLVYRVRIITNDPDNVFRQGMPVSVHVPADH